VEADRFEDSDTCDWIEFSERPTGATKLVLRVKASAVWKIERLP
jgi:hypothetical protein